MKPLLFVLLAASLVANIALLIQSRHSTPAVVPSIPAPPAGISSPVANNPNVPSESKPGGQTSTSSAAPAAWPPAATDQELHHLVAGLRSAGYPPSVIRAVINQLLNERFAARQPNAGLSFWKRSMPTPETMAAQTALNSERQALFEALLGPDARPSALLDADARERRYGPLADDKIDAIARIERDYNELSAESWAKRRGNVASSMETMMQTQQLMEKEKLTDLSAVLAPDELAQYEMRNSNSARTLINNLRNVDITAAEYARMFAAQKNFDDTNPLRATMDATTYMQRQVAQLALNDQARTILGDARFYSYLEGADHNYALTAQTLAKYPTVTPATSYQVYQLQIDLQNQLTQASRNGAMSTDQAEAMRTTVAAYNTRLETALGPDIADAYRNQNMGRVFSSFRITPRPPVPVTK